MKKSKILMPLVGVAALGATVAPIVTLTSCNKNASNIFASIGYVEDRVGSDYLATAAGAGDVLPMPIKGTLVKTLGDQHYFKRSWNAKEETGKVFFMAKQEPEKIEDAYELEEKSYLNTINIQINQTNYAKWKTGTTSETFEFDVTYEEFDSKDASVGKQVVHYSFTAYPNKLACPVVLFEAMTGTVTAKEGTSEEFNLNGLSFATKPEGDVKVTLGNTSLTLKDKETEKVNLVVKNSSETQTTNEINFKATLTNVPATAKATDTYKFVIEENLLVNVAVTGGKYVRDNWTQTIYVDLLKEASADTITITLK